MSRVITELDCFATVKTCSKCHVPQPLTAFHKKRHSKAGARAVCKTCRSAQSRRPPKPSQLPDAAQLWVEYQKIKNVHKLAAIYGVTGETVRAHLNRAGFRTVRHSPGVLSSVSWSPADIALLQEWYASHDTSGNFSLETIAHRLGKLKSNVSRKARTLGLTNISRRKVLNRKPPKPNKFDNAEDRNRHVGECVKRYIETNGHPRGASGMRHSDKAKATISAHHKRLWADPQSKFNSEEARQRRSDVVMQRIRDGNPLAGTHPYSRCKRGFREDIGGQWFKSSWEANYARYLIFLKARGEIRDWEYEPHTFYFEAIKRGTRSYTPDFKVTLKNSHEWHEVKGWMDDKSKTRIARMAKYYPLEKLIVIDAAWFKQAGRTGIDRLIPNWERPEKKTVQIVSV